MQQLKPCISVCLLQLQVDSVIEGDAAVAWALACIFCQTFLLALYFTVDCLITEHN